MRLPLRYVLRNTFRRSRHTAMTVTGIAISVFASVLMLALAYGLYSRLDVTGEPENVLAISRKGQNIMFSNIEEDALVPLMALDGVAVSPYGEQLISPEIMHMALARAGGQDDRVGTTIYVRGVRDVAMEVHPSVTLLDGHFPEDEFEIMVGVSAYVKFGVDRTALSVGKLVTFEGQEWPICGVFESNGAMFESEIWTRLDDLKTVLKRRSPTFVVIRCESEETRVAAMGAFQSAGVLFRDFKVWPEREYYREFTGALNWIYWLSLVMVVAVTLAGGLIGVNTMYTAIINRTSEIATQRVLGFSRSDIAQALFAESILVAGLGGAIGVACGFLVDDIPMRTSQGAFFITVNGVAVGLGLALAILIGIVGAAVPQLKSMRMQLVQAMRNE